MWTFVLLVSLHFFKNSLFLGPILVLLSHSTALAIYSYYKSQLVVPKLCSCFHSLSFLFLFRYVLLWHEFNFLYSFHISLYFIANKSTLFFFNVLFVSSDAFLVYSFLKLLINYCFSHFKQLALSSDKIASLQMPLLNLYLDVKENGEVKPYSVEMSKVELQKLINSLEAANKVCVLILLCASKCLRFDWYHWSYIRKANHFHLKFVLFLILYVKHKRCFVDMFCILILDITFIIDLH